MREYPGRRADRLKGRLVVLGFRWTRPCPVGKATASLFRRPTSNSAACTSRSSGLGPLCDFGLNCSTRARGFTELLCMVTSVRLRPRPFKPAWRAAFTCACMFGSLVVGPAIGPTQRAERTLVRYSCTRKTKKVSRECRGRGESKMQAASNSIRALMTRTLRNPRPEHLLTHPRRIESSKHDSLEEPRYM